MTKTVIIGGSDVGIITGLRIRELDKNSNVTIVSNNSFPNFSICGLPFYLGGEVKHYKNLAHRTANDIQSTGLNLMLDSTATSIDIKNKTVTVIDKNNKTIVLRYDKLVLGTGGKSIKPNIEGIDLPNVFFLRWVNDALKIDDYIKNNNPESVIIIGGGYIGLEMCEAFIKRGLKVILIEFLDSILTTVDKEFSEIVKEKLQEKGAKIITGKKVEKIEENNGKLKVITSQDFNATADMVLVAVGTIPETELGKSIGIETGMKNAFKVNNKLETNIPDIYAGGDCVESFNNITKKPLYIPLGTIAHKHGRIIGENICGWNSKYPGTLGTQSIKLFDIVISRTGLRDKEAKEAGFSPMTIKFETTDHKVYYPPSYNLKLHFTADRGTKRILGCQIMGDINAEVSKRIDIIASAIHKKVTAPEFIQMDLSYTPPLSNPWDPTQMAASEWLNNI